MPDVASNIETQIHRKPPSLIGDLRVEHPLQTTISSSDWRTPNVGKDSSKHAFIVRKMRPKRYPKHAVELSTWRHQKNTINPSVGVPVQTPRPNADRYRSSFIGKDTRRWMKTTARCHRDLSFLHFVVENSHSLSFLCFVCGCPLISIFLLSFLFFLIT